MIAVIGAGAIGVLSAYYLARDRHEVTLIDRNPGPAQECSFGNAGLIAVGHAEAWAGPAAPATIISSVLGLDPAVKVTKPFDLALARWGLSFLSNCTSRAQRHNTDALFRLSDYSRTLMDEVEQDLGTEKLTTPTGGLYLHLDKKRFRHRVAQLKKDGHDTILFEILEPETLLQTEPAFAVFKDDIAGGILSKRDYYRNCLSCVSEILAKIEEMPNVKVLFGADVTNLRQNATGITLETTQSNVECRQVVFASGSEPPVLLRQLGARPNIYPVKGYSITYPVLDESRVPTLPFVAETNLCAVSAEPGSLRVTAIAEFAGQDKSLTGARFVGIDDYARRMFGDALDYKNSLRWTGLRPTTPSSRPYLGRLLVHPDIWINAGHGQLGWTTAAGSGRVLADLMAGNTPAISCISEVARWLEPF